MCSPPLRSNKDAMPLEATRRTISPFNLRLHKNVLLVPLYQYRKNTPPLPISMALVISL